MSSISGHAELCNEKQKELEQKFSDLQKMVSSFDPLSLLLAAWYYKHTEMQGVKRDIDFIDDKPFAARLPELVQSLLAISPTTGDGNINQEQFRLFCNLAIDVLKLQSFFNVNETAVHEHDKVLGGGFLRENLQRYNLFSRGKNFPCHWYKYYEDMFLPMDGILKYKFGLTAGEFIQNLKNFHEKMPNVISSEDIDIVNKINTCEIFKLDDHFPNEILEALSFTAGQGLDYFGIEWMLVEWPTFRKPFIKVNDSYYCFDMELIPDRIYNAMQEAVDIDNPQTKEIWNKQERSASIEQVAVKYLSEILPGSEVYTNIRYESDEYDPPRECECDCVIIYDNEMLIVEVKGGLEDLPSARTDFDCLVERVNKYIYKPMKQAVRLKRALENHGNVEIYEKINKKKRILANINNEKIKHVTVVAVTLHSLTEFASQFYRLEDIGVNTDIRDAFILSIDDLRLFANGLFGNPLMFLHFMHKRIKAGNLENLIIDDMLYHIGMYLEHNDYSLYIREFNAKQALVGGYRGKIDEHFTGLPPGAESHGNLRQDMPFYLEGALDAIAQSNTNGRFNVARHLLDLDGKGRNAFNRYIEYAIDVRVSRGKTMILNMMPSENYASTAIYLKMSGQGGMGRALARENALAALLISGESKSLLLEIKLDDNFRVCGIWWEWLSEETLNKRTPEVRRHVLALAENTRQKRNAWAMRNENFYGKRGFVSGGCEMPLW